MVVGLARFALYATSDFKYRQLDVIDPMRDNEHSSVGYMMQTNRYAPRGWRASMTILEYESYSYWVMVAPILALSMFLISAVARMYADILARRR